MTDTTGLVLPKSIPMILLILPSISRLRIRLVLACNHYQTLVCYCQADMSRSPVMCPTATSEPPDLPWAIVHRRNHCGARTPACRVHTRVNAGLRHVANGTGHIYRLPGHVGWASDKVEVPLGHLCQQLASSPRATRTATPPPPHMTVAPRSTWPNFFASRMS